MVSMHLELFITGTHLCQFRIFFVFSQVLIHHTNSKATNFGDCDYDHDTHENDFIFFMVDP